MAGDRLSLNIFNVSYLVKMGLGALLLVAIVGAVGFYTVDQTANVLGQEAETEYTQRADQQARRVNDWLSSMDRQAEVLANAESVQEGDNVSEIDAFLESQLRARTIPREIQAGAIHYVNYTGDGARVLATTNDSQLGQPSGNVPWATGGVSRRTTNVFWYGNTPDRKLMAFVVPINRTKRERAIVMSVNLKQASVGLPKPKDGRTVAVRSNGIVMLSTNPGDIGKSVTNLGYIPQEALDNAGRGMAVSGAGTKYSENFTVNGSKMVTGYTPTSYLGQNYIAISQVPRGVAYNLRSEIESLMMLLVGAMLVGSLLVVGTLGYTTVRDLRKLSSKAQQVADGDFDVPLETGRGDEIGQAYDSVDRMRDSLQEKIAEAESAAETAEHARREQERLNEELTQRVDQFSEKMERAAEGDLGVRLDADTDVEQLNDLAEDVNEMLDAIEESVKETKEFSETVAAASTEAEAAMSDVREASDDIAMAMQEINDGAKEQNEQLNATVEEMNHLASTTEEIASSLNEVSKIAQQTAETGEEGIDMAREAIDEMERVDEESTLASEEMEQLLDWMDEIDEMTDFIQEVAKETNMLALNANIEASRGGGGGDQEGGGFDVVAQEIKELSAQAQESAQDIDDLIEDVRAQAESTAEEVELTRELIGSSTETVRETVDAFEDIADFAEQTNQGIQEMNRATQSQANTTQEVVTMVEQSSGISDMTAREAEDVAAAAEEQTSSIREVSESVENLSERATRLADLVDQFSVGNGHDGDDVEWESAGDSGDADDGGFADDVIADDGTGGDGTDDADDESAVDVDDEAVADAGEPDSDDD